MDKKELEDKIEEADKEIQFFDDTGWKEGRKDAVEKWKELVEQRDRVEELEERLNELTIKELEALAEKHEMPFSRSIERKE